MLVQLPQSDSVIKVRVVGLESEFNVSSGLHPVDLEVPDDTLLLVWSAGGDSVALMAGDDVWRPYDPEGRHNIETLRGPEPECDLRVDSCDPEDDRNLGYSDFEDSDEDE